jgi:hypothetical protein
MFRNTRAILSAPSQTPARFILTLCAARAVREGPGGEEESANSDEICRWAALGRCNTLNEIPDEKLTTFEGIYGI